MSIWVVKVGGSLLGRSDLPDRIAEVVAELKPFASLILLTVGGGARVDSALAELQELHRQVPIRDEIDVREREVARHWVAIRAMQLNALPTYERLLPQIPELRWCVSFRQLLRLVEQTSVAAEKASKPATMALIDLAQLALDDHGETLPIGDDISSDSMSAWLCQRLVDSCTDPQTGHVDSVVGCESDDRISLLLLKSVDPPEIAECQRRSSEAEKAIGSDRLFAWAEAGLVDRQFPYLAKSLRVETKCVPPIADSGVM